MDYDRYRRIPNALKRCRETKGLSQGAVATLLGFKDKTWISHWENGDALPNLVSAIRLSAIYGVSVNELFPQIAAHVAEELSHGAPSASP